MMQIYLKPSYRKMIMRAIRQTEDTHNDVIVFGAVCNPVSHDVRSNGPEIINTQRYKIKDYGLKSNFNIEGLKSNFNI